MIRWMAVSLVMVGTSLGQAPPTAQTTAPVMEVLINAAGENGGKPTQVAEFGLQLASRVQQAEQQGTATNADAARGLQALSVTGNGADATAASANGATDNAGAGPQLPSLAGVG